MSKGLFSKLAVTNIKNNKQFYVPYLLTGILTVGMFYIMCALAGNKGIEHMSGARDLQMILNLGIGVIGIFSVIFLFYTNSFIIKRRKKELYIFTHYSPLPLPEEASTMSGQIQTVHKMHLPLLKPFLSSLRTAFSDVRHELKGSLVYAPYQ